MPMNFILDTTFMHHLRRFDAYYREYHRLDASEKGPFDGLEHLAQKGATIVLPNEVLRQLTVNVKGESIGLGLDEHNAPILDPALLKTRRLSTPLIDYLCRKSETGALRCFASVKDFEAASCAGDLSGKIAIIATSPLAKGNGAFSRALFDQRKQTQPNITDWNEHEILTIVNRLVSSPSAYSKKWDTACYLLTSNGPLAGRFRQAGTSLAGCEALFMTPYFEVLNQTHFPTPSGILQSTARAYDVSALEPIPFGKPMDEKLKTKIGETLAAFGLRPANRIEAGTSATDEKRIAAAPPRFSAKFLKTGQ